MLEDVFVDPAAVRRQRSCILGVYLDAFCAHLADLGYPGRTIRHKVWIVVGLARWMADESVAIGNLDERRVVRFVEAGRRRGRTCDGFERTALQLIEHLRSAGVVPSPEPVRDDSPATALLARYEEYLCRERAVAQSTITAYRAFVRAFVVERLADSALRRHARQRDRLLADRSSPAFFIAERGSRVTTWSAQYTFAAVSRAVGLRAPSSGHRHGRGPRLHDLRHRLAVRTLVRWYREGKDVERELPKLTTYLGHAHVADTYWYPEAVPELLQLATERVSCPREVTS